MLHFLIDYLFPKNENTVEIEKLTAYEIAEQAKPAPRIPHDFIHAIFSYKDKLIKDALWEIKYRSNKKIAELFAPLLLDKVVEVLSEQAMFTEKEKPLLITIPPSKSREQKKGFDQGKLILNALEKSDTTHSFEIKYDVLERKHATKQQSLLHNKLERLENIHNAFGVTNESLIQGRVVVVIDDIVTTGATMIEAKRVLENAGVRAVYGISIAH